MRSRTTTPFRSTRVALAVLVASALVAVVTVVAGEQPVRAADAQRASVEVDFGARDGDLLRTERFNTWDNGHPEPELRADDVGFLNEQGLHADLVRIGFDVDSDLCDVQAQECDFGPVEWIDDASNLTESLVVHLTPEGIFSPDVDPADMVPLLTLAITELKDRVPNLRYIEASNEPEVSRYYIRKRFGLEPTLRPEQLYQWYVPFYEAVNAVNAELHPSDRIEVGGPTLASFDHEGWIPAFLDGYAADPNPRKRLDFISWHAYGYFAEDGRSFNFYKDDLTLVATQRARLDAMLEERHITKQIPAFVTETGIYPGPAFDEADPSKNDWLRQAAGMASLHYWYSDQPRTIPFNWTVRHTNNGRKDQLITLRGEGETSPTDTFTPYGNMLLMQSKMKTTRVEAVSDTLDAGLGIYAVASKDQTGASLMVWNYQGTNDERFETTINMSHLPSNLRHGPVRQTMYRIDQNTSNYWADPAQANLQQVDEKIVMPGRTYVETVDLDPNAVFLITMEPLVSGA